MKNCEIIEKILADDPLYVCPPSRGIPLDVFKYGNPQVECTGIVCAIASSVGVIRKAAELGYNLIISHENAFYIDTDAYDWLKGNEVFEEKAALLDEHDITLWRYHDHMHHHNPDKMFRGISRELGWTEYEIGGRTPNGGIYRQYMLPQKVKLGDLAKELKEKFGLNGLRVIGNFDAEVQKVGFLAHIFFAMNMGDKTMATEKIHTVDVWDGKFEALITFETLDWTTLSYVRDAAELGKPLGLLAVGHFNIEALGMRDMAKTWLPELLDNAVPVKYIEAGDMFKYI
jgi:putative NIF3 family GTP cyclohydrolase 1 type 2